MTAPAGIDPSAAPSGPGCALCTAGDGPGWWSHLRCCAQCGEVGCCDSSPSQPAPGPADRVPADWQRQLHR